MRQALLASLVLLTLLSCGGRTERPASISRSASEPFGVAYGPALVRNRLKPDEARQFWFQNYVPSGPEYGHEKPSSFISHQYGVPGHQFSEGSLPRVFGVSQHPLLAALTDGAPLYLAHTYYDGSPFLAATRAGRAYDLRLQLGILLRDCGMRFTRDDTKDWARALATMWVSESLLWGCADTDPVIPALRFDSVTTQRTGRFKADVKVFFELNGAPRHMEFPVYIYKDAAGDTIWYPDVGRVDGPEQGVP